MLLFPTPSELPILEEIACLRAAFADINIAKDRSVYSIR
jgi:hypothetical protein